MSKNKNAVYEALAWKFNECKYRSSNWLIVAACDLKVDTHIHARVELVYKDMSCAFVSTLRFDTEYWPLKLQVWVSGCRIGCYGFFRCCIDTSWLHDWINSINPIKRSVLHRYWWIICYSCNGWWVRVFAYFACWGCYDTRTSNSVSLPPLFHIYFAYSHIKITSLFLALCLTRTMLPNSTLFFFLIFPTKKLAVKALRQLRLP